MFNILAGVAALWVANFLLNPVPLAAALAWALGLLLFWLLGSRSLRWASVGVLSGVALGATVHLSAHHTGRSAVPPEGLFMHVLWDATIGLTVGLIALAASLGRLLWREY